MVDCLGDKTPEKHRAAAVSDKMEPDNRLIIEQTPDETGAQAMARKMLEPVFKNAAASSAFMDKMLGTEMDMPGLHDYITNVEKMTDKAAAGEIDIVSRMLAAQAMTLDAMFTECARRSAVNMVDYPNASERYGRMALKAQTNCRATLQALSYIHRPREQTVKHVHVNEGGQAIVAEQFHHNGVLNGKSADQSQAAGNPGQCATLPCQDAEGVVVPIASR